MNLKNIGLILLISALILNGIATIKLLSKKNKVAYVKTSIMLDEYVGMKEAKKVYKTKAEGWNKQLDSLKAYFNGETAMYEQKASSMTQDKKKEEELRLNILYNKLSQLKEAIERKAKQEDQEMTDGVLKQINSYVELYSKKNNIDMVIGTTLSGNLLFGSEDIDITQDLIKGLNEEYTGKKD